MDQVTADCWESFYLLRIKELQEARSMGYRQKGPPPLALILDCRLYAGKLPLKKELKCFLVFCFLVETPSNKRGLSIYKLNLNRNVYL